MPDIASANAVRRPPPFTLTDLHALGSLGFDSVAGITTLVEEMHRNIAHVSPPFGAAPEGGAPGISGRVYATVRGVTRLLGDGWRLAGGVLPPNGAAVDDPRRAAWIAALNGVWGDHLEASANPLAIAMTLRHAGQPLSLDRATLAARFGEAPRKLLVLLHGLCMNDLQWTRNGHDHGAALADALGYLPIYVRYNSGRHIAANGRDLAELLERLVEHWPGPIDELALLGHSMGGLVARSAACHAEAQRMGWRRLLRRIAFLGTPHHGAPLERAGNYLDLAVELSPYVAPFARLGKARSAGIKDLRHGNTRAEDHRESAPGGTRDHRRPMPLPAGVRCHAVAASLQEAPGLPGSRTRGDGLVPVGSALGRHHRAVFQLGFAAADTCVAYGTSHFGLLDSDAVARQLIAWFGAD